jgi:hypothetical protein
LEFHGKYSVWLDQHCSEGKKKEFIGTVQIHKLAKFSSWRGKQKYEHHKNFK